jgi:maltooligosyltrehalose trehalohydrolase
MHYKRKYPIGAEWIQEKGVHFRLWCPKHNKVELVLENIGKKPLFIKMQKEKGNYYSYFSTEASEGTLYRFRLDDSKEWYSDPASRYQPNGPFGPSEVIAIEYPWRDKLWKGIEVNNQVAYEMHIGTFTEDGTFEAAKRYLPHLAKLGITFIEILPINEFPGYFGWGYDGVNLFAPTHLYGHIKNVKSFIDKAHELGIGVILDVVYNHIGFEGNQMIAFADQYLSETYKTNWGKAVNFEDSSSREYFLTNARYWIEEFHFDGLRLDATPYFFSTTKVHILEELSRTIKKAGGKRKTLIIGENEPQNSKLLMPYEKGGYGFDMLWNDDFHHSAVVRLTGKREAYYTDYLGSPQEFISLIKYGFLYQGQYYDWQKKKRGMPNFELPKYSMMVFLENHDQLANSGQGKRLHQKADFGNYKAMVAYFLLSPNTPLIFQGQEFNAKAPFYYFADHSPDLARLIRKGRQKEVAQFPHLATSEAKKEIKDPDNLLTFVCSKLNFDDLNENKHIFFLFQDLIKLRKTDAVFSKMQNIKIDGAILGNDSLILRYFGEEDGDRLILINFGVDQNLNPCPEPLLAYGINEEIEVLWSSESVIYGGEGTPPLSMPYWKILGHSTIVLKVNSKKEEVK